jgi:hypothetical protein
MIGGIHWLPQVVLCRERQSLGYADGLSAGILWLSTQRRLSLLNMKQRRDKLSTLEILSLSRSYRVAKTRS